MRLTIATPTNARIMSATPRMNSGQGMVPMCAAYLSTMMRKICGIEERKDLVDDGEEDGERPPSSVGPEVREKEAS